MAYTTLLTRREHGVEWLTLNRPDVRNAFNDAMIAELATWADDVRHSPDVRVVVVSGAGKTFSAGADVTWMAKTIGYTKEQNLQDALEASRMFTALNTLPMPVVARVHGAALGGGAGLCAVCDVVVAEESAIFGFTEVKLGIIPGVISPFVIEKIGRSAVRALFLTGARFSAAHAKEIGLVHRLTGSESLDTTVQAVVSELLTGGREAMAAAKTLIASVASMSLEVAQAFTAEAIAERRVSPEGQEGLNAFLEKRPPSWDVR